MDQGLCPSTVSVMLDDILDFEHCQEFGADFGYNQRLQASDRLQV